MEKNLLDVERKYCSWGDTVHYNDQPKLFNESENHYLIDFDGRRFLDMQTAYSSTNFGYQNTLISKKVIEQIQRLPMLASESLTKEKILLSQRINNSIERWSGISGKVHFNVGGAQAIDDALKLVAKTTRKKYNFAFEGSYHGRTIGASSITSSFRYRHPFGNIVSRGVFIPYPYCFRCPLGGSVEHCDLGCLHLFHRLFQNEYHSIIETQTGECEMGAFFIEPLQGTGGYIVPPKNYFCELGKILKKHNIILVDDEIQMGMFRTGKQWALEHFNTQPDIITFGKSITNGLNPLSGFWARDPLATPENWGPGSTHSTYGSNPIGMAAGLAAFDFIDSNELGKQVIEKGSFLLEALKDLKSRYSVIGDVDGLGLAIRIEICGEDGFTPNPQLALRIKLRGLQGDLDNGDGVNGVVLDIGGYYKNVLTLAPPLTIDFLEIKIFIKMLNLILEKCAS